MKTIVKFFLKLLAGCLVVLTVAMFGLGAYSMVSFSNSNDLYDLSTSLGQKLSSRVYQFLGKEYTKPEVVYGSSIPSKIPTDDLFLNNVAPETTVLQYVPISCTEHRTSPDDDSSSTTSYVYKFDRSGRLLRDEHAVYVYNDDGQLIAVLWGNYRGYKYSYDSKGRLTQRISTMFSGQEIYKIQWKYNDSGQVTQMSCSDYEDKQESRTVFSYKSGNVTKETFYDEDDVLSGWRINSYDDNGNRIKTVKYSSDGTVEETWMCKFDNSGNCTSRVGYSNDDSIADWKITYVYDDNNHQTSVKYSRLVNGKQTKEIQTFKYDENGNLLKKTIHCNEEDLESGYPIEVYDISVMRYDENNNMVKSMSINDTLYPYDLHESRATYTYQSIYDYVASHAQDAS